MAAIRVGHSFASFGLVPCTHRPYYRALEITPGRTVGGIMLTEGIVSAAK
jgi:hypothetical protein